MLAKPTSRGYLRFWCERCERTFNERTATPFNFLEGPTDIMFRVVLWRVRHKLSLRDLAEMFLQRGFPSLVRQCAIGRCGLDLCWQSICAANGTSMPGGVGMWMERI